MSYEDKMIEDNRVDELNICNPHIEFFMNLE